MGCAVRSRTNTTSCPVLVTNVICFTSLVWRTPQSPEEKLCVYDAIRKNQNSNSKSKNPCSLPFSLLKTAASFQPFLLKEIRFHTRMGRNLTRLCLLANPQQAEKKKISFLSRTRCMRTGLSSTFFTGWAHVL